MLDKDIKKQIDENNKKLDLYDERVRMAKVNQRGYKFFMSFVFSLTAYLGINLACLGLTMNGHSILLGNIIDEFLPFFIVGGSFAIGDIVRRIFYKKNKLNKRFKAFSSAKSEEAIMEEEIKYSWEFEKTKNRNNVLYKLNSFLNSYGNITFSRDKDTLKKEMENMEIILQKKYDELDKLSLKEVLCGKIKKDFWSSKKVIDSILKSFMGGIFALMAVMAPALVLEITFGKIAFFLTFFIGFSGTFGYLKESDKVSKKIKEKFNAFLGEDKVSESEIDIVGYLSVRQGVKDKINDIVIGEREYHQMKRMQQTTENNSVSHEYDDMLDYLKIIPLDNDKTMSRSRKNR